MQLFYHEIFCINMIHREQHSLTQYPRYLSSEQSCLLITYSNKPCISDSTIQLHFMNFFVYFRGQSSLCAYHQCKICIKVWPLILYHPHHILYTFSSDKIGRSSSSSSLQCYLKILLTKRLPILMS